MIYTYLGPYNGGVEKIPEIRLQEHFWGWKLPAIDSLSENKSVVWSTNSPLLIVLVRPLSTSKKTHSNFPPENPQDFFGTAMNCLNFQCRVMSSHRSLAAPNDLDLAFGPGATDGIPGARPKQFTHLRLSLPQKWENVWENELMQPFFEHIQTRSTVKHSLTILPFFPLISGNLFDIPHVLVISRLLQHARGQEQPETGSIHRRIGDLAMEKPGGSLVSLLPSWWRTSEQFMQQIIAINSKYSWDLWWGSCPFVIVCRLLTPTIINHPGQAKIVIAYHSIKSLTDLRWLLVGMCLQCKGYTVIT